MAGDALVGKSIGNYRLVRSLGVGGMGAVYLGEHPEIHSRVAIKVLLPNFVENENITRRFFDEARAVNRIGHAGIVRIHDCGRDDEAGVFLVMELLEGKTLDDHLRDEGPFNEQRVVRLLRQTTSALEASHRAGIIHRDLKPSNLFVVADPEIPGGERIKILDFGIAKLLEDREATSPKPEVTKTGMILGSLLFMSPEQGIDTKYVDERTDIYSLGVIGFNLLSGAFPFEAETIGQLVLKQQNGEPEQLRSLVPQVSESLAAIIHRAMAVDPDQRFDSMIALRDALDELSELPAPAKDTAPGVDLPVSEAGRKMTTLSGTAAELISLRTGRRTFFGGTLALLLVAGSVAVWLATRSDSEPGPLPAGAAQSATPPRDAGAPEKRQQQQDLDVSDAVGSTDVSAAPDSSQPRRRRRPGKTGTRPRRKPRVTQPKGSPDASTEKPRKPYFNEL